MGARIPEELEMLLEDASVMRDIDALPGLFVDGAVVVDGGRSAGGSEDVIRLVASRWEAGHRHVAGEGHVVQARDLAVVVGPDGISVMRRGRTTCGATPS